MLKIDAGNTYIFAKNAKNRLLPLQLSFTFRATKRYSVAFTWIRGVTYDAMVIIDQCHDCSGTNNWFRTSNCRCYNTTQSNDVGDTQYIPEMRMRKKRITLISIFDIYAEWSFGGNRASDSRSIRSIIFIDTV